MLSNNKFLGKCWYGRHSWIRLAMDCERMVEKGINFIFCLGTDYDISSMESVGNSKSFSLVGKVCLPKCFYLPIFALSSGTSTNPYFPLRRAFLLLYAIFNLCWVSIFSYKAPTREHYCHTFALDVANVECVPWIDQWLSIMARDNFIWPCYFEKTWLLS